MKKKRTEDKNLLQSLKKLERLHDRILNGVADFRIEALALADVCSRAAAEPNPATFLALKKSDENMDELEKKIRKLKKKES